MMVAAVLPPASAFQRRQYVLQAVIVTMLLGSFQFLMSPSDVFEGGVGPKVFLLLRMAGLLVLCTWFLRLAGERWAYVGLRPPPRWWWVPLLAAGGFMLLYAVSGVMSHVVLPALGAAPPALDSLQALRGDPARFLYAAIPVAWGSAAFGEELVVRGFLLDRIAKGIGSSRTPAYVAAIIIQAVLFGACHLYQGIGGALLTGAIGLVIGLVWFGGRRNLWACIVLHGVVNSLTFIAAYTAGAKA